MSQKEPLTASIALERCGTVTLRQPDQLHLVFDQPLLRSIAKALATLTAQNEAKAWLTLYLGHNLPFFAPSSPWRPRGDDDGDFVVSAVWMHVTADALSFEVWESRGDDQLHGSIKLPENFALRTAVEQHLHWAEDSLLQDLHALCAAHRLSPDAMRDMVRTRRRAEPWLEKMAVNLASGVLDDVLDGSDAQLSLPRALTFAPAPMQATAQSTVARSAPPRKC